MPLFRPRVPDIDAALRRLLAAVVRRPVLRLLELEPMPVLCPRDEALWRLRLEDFIRLVAITPLLSSVERVSSRAKRASTARVSRARDECVLRMRIPPTRDISTARLIQRARRHTDGTNCQTCSGHSDDARLRSVCDWWPLPWRSYAAKWSPIPADDCQPWLLFRISGVGRTHCALRKQQ